MLLGALTALQLDLVIAAGERLMHPVGQQALLRTTATAGLTGLLFWVVWALLTRTISRTAVKPYKALADHFERLADGTVDGPLDLREPVPGVRRLARAVIVFHQRALASQRSEALLQARYDSLFQEYSDERRLLMGMLMSGRLDPEGHAAVTRSHAGGPPAAPEIPEPPSARPQAAGGPTPYAARYDSLYEDRPEERRLLMGLLLSGQSDPAGRASVRRSFAGEAPAGFEIPEPPFATRQAPGGPAPRTGQVVDPTGRLTFPARRAEEGWPDTSVAPDLMLDFAIRR